MENTNKIVNYQQLLIARNKSGDLLNDEFDYASHIDPSFQHYVLDQYMPYFGLSRHPESHFGMAYKRKNEWFIKKST